MQLDTLIQFIIATAIVTIIPGPNILLIVNESVQKKTRNGLIASLGVTVGMITLFSVSLAGISALLIKWTWLFNLVRILGMGYLIYLGLTILVSATKIHPANAASASAIGNSFLRGFLISITNPKGLVFAGAFFPQFLDNALPLMPQVILLCSACLIVATVIGSTYAVFAGNIRAVVQSGVLARYCAYLSGLTLILFGISLIFTDLGALV